MKFPYPHQVDPEYTSKLRQRLGEGVVVAPVEVSIGNWKPQPNRCHENVTIWCQNNPDFRAVRGWLYMDMTGQLDFEVFLAHSVIQDSGGKFWDITPLQALERYPFIPAVETEEEYAKRNEQGGTRLVHYK